MGALDEAKAFWDSWEVQGYVVFALILQITLIVFGSRRKNIAKNWIKVLVWFAYLGAIWTADSSLGNIGSNMVYIEGYKGLKEFWPPFFLVLLGSPDTITAYAVEDNSLWLRLLLDFIVDVGGAIYVFILTWSPTKLTSVAAAMHVVGIIKYGERAYVRHKSSFQNFKESLHSNPDPFPDLVKIKKQVIEEKFPENIDIGQKELNESDLLIAAFFLFKRFAHFFTGLVLDNSEVFLSFRIFERLGPQKVEDAFNLVAVELGIMYDFLYTKATIAYSRVGIILRCISVFISFSIFVIFFTVIDMSHYRRSDKVITYALLIVNVLIEGSGVILLFHNDWATIIHLTKYNNCAKGYFRSPRVHFRERKRWSGTIGQFNLISSSLKEVSASNIGFHKLYSISPNLKRYQHRTFENVSADLRKIIFYQFFDKMHKKELHQKFNDIHLREEILAHRGDYVLERYDVLADFQEFTLDVEFDHSLLLWHIATDICCYDDFDTSNIHPNCKISNCLSDYMVYLLVICPSMMPKGIGEIRLADTSATAKKFFKSIKDLKSKSKQQVCKMFLNDQTNVEGSADEQTVAKGSVDEQTVVDVQADEQTAAKGSVAKQTVVEGSADKHLYSVLTEGIELARKLKMLNDKTDWDRERKWKMISEVWVEMLAYAANDRDWIEDGIRLSRGGELLTHVAVLMAHLGLSNQYRKKGRKID